MSLYKFPITVSSLFLVSAVLCTAGCQEKDENALRPVQPTQSHKISKEKTIVVPPVVAGAWKSVKLSVIDKARATEGTYNVPVGGTTRIPSTTLDIHAEAFLPAFVMEGTVITSLSNELTNPGVKVEVKDNGVVIYSGWLFSKYPNTHSFTHPKYGFTLVGAVPAAR